MIVFVSAKAGEARKNNRTNGSRGSMGQSHDRLRAVRLRGFEKAVRYSNIQPFRRISSDSMLAQWLDKSK